MIIGFAHKKRVGKDTAGDYLVKKYHFNKIWFAKALYEECKGLHIIMPKEINNNSLVCFGFLGNPFFLKLKCLIILLGKFIRPTMTCSTLNAIKNIIINARQLWLSANR